LRSPFLLKFMIVIHTTYVVMKMLGPKGLLTIQGDQLDALACENASLAHAGRLGDKATQDQATKAAKNQGGITLQNASTVRPLICSSPRTPMGTLAQKTVNTTSSSAQLTTDPKVDNKKKGTIEDENNKKILANHADPEKKLKIGP
jgi:hypothetical protein